MGDQGKLVEGQRVIITGGMYAGERGTIERIQYGWNYLLYDIATPDGLKPIVALGLHIAPDEAAQKADQDGQAAPGSTDA